MTTTPTVMKRAKAMSTSGPCRPETLVPAKPRGAVLALALLGAAPAVDSAGNPAPIGHWEGQINAELTVMVDLDRNTDGTWQGHMDVPTESVYDLALDILVDGTSVRFDVPLVPGKPSCVGILAGNGERLSGKCRLNGTPMPFDLERKSTVPEPPAEVDPSIAEWIGEGGPGEGVTAQWRGAVILGSTALRLALEIGRTGDGAFSGTIRSVDQGNIATTLDALIQLKENVTFAVPAVGGHYDGRLSEDGSALTGTWTQRGVSLPLTLKRVTVPADPSPNSQGSGV